ncbi:MAG: hypothetical protein WDW38_000828 [Sanguina aurantia]
MQHPNIVLSSSSSRTSASQGLRPTAGPHPSHRLPSASLRSLATDTTKRRLAQLHKSTVSHAYGGQQESSSTSREPARLFRQDPGALRPVSAYGMRDDGDVPSSRGGGPVTLDRSSQGNASSQMPLKPSTSPVLRLSRRSVAVHPQPNQRHQQGRTSKQADAPPLGSFFVNGFNINGNGAAAPSPLASSAPSHDDSASSHSTARQAPSLRTSGFSNSSGSSYSRSQAPSATPSEAGWDYKYAHLPCSSPCSPHDIPMRQLEALFQNTLNCPRLPCRVHDFMQREVIRRQTAADQAFRNAIKARARGSSSSNDGSSSYISDGGNGDLHDLDEEESGPSPPASPPPVPTTLARAPPHVLPISQITLCIETLARQYGRELVLFWVCRTPRILLCNAATTPAHIEAIRLMLDLQGSDMAMLLRKNPYLLVTDIGCLRFRFEALHRSTTLDHEQILFMVKKCPLVFNFEGETLARLVANLRDLSSTRELWHQDFEQITPSLLAFFIRDHTDLLLRLEFLVVTGESPTKHLKEIFKISNNLFLRIHHGYRMWLRMRTMRAQARARNEEVEEVQVKPSKKIHFHSYR